MISKSPRDTKELAKKLAGSSRKRIFALVGDLGSGKTAFVQAFLRALGIKQRITSPTFLIFRKFQNPNSKFQTAYHVDCYRLDNPKELLKLGFREILADKNNIVLVEWADKIKELLPKETQWIYFKHGRNEKEREIVYN